jgi:hypothetical protein
VTASANSSAGLSDAADRYLLERHARFRTARTHPAWWTRLKERYQVLLLSNTNAIHVPAFEAIIARENGITDFKELFHGAYYSCEIGLRKPDAASFLHVLEKHGADPCARSSSTIASNTCTVRALRGCMPSTWNWHKEDVIALGLDRLKLIVPRSLLPERPFFGLWVRGALHLMRRSMTANSLPGDEVFGDEVVVLRSRIGRRPLTSVLQGGTLGHDLHEELIIADEGHRLAIRVQCEFTEHGLHT